MKVGVFGGSFDPIHRGHVEPVEAARRALGLDRVLFLPTARPPHKPDRRFAPALARYAMAELALLEREGLEVSTLELTGERPAYTVETLERLRAESPGDELWLLVGSDSLAQLHTWRRFRDLLAGFPVAVLVRPGSESEGFAPGLDPELAAALATARVAWMPNSPLPISASEIRARLARGEEPPAGWLDPRVLTFIRKYRLYR
jgi:nicotinate-nucleotide adenylyltransferase